MEQEENFFKVFKLVTGPGTETVRHIFDTLFPPATLNATLNSHKNTTINDLKRKRRITSAQDALLFPPTGTGATSVAFDITLMICLIRNLTTVPKTAPPVNGWDMLPTPAETTIGADIARIKYIRNLLAHSDRNVMTNSDFNTHWSCLYDAILRHGGAGLKLKCDNIKNLRLISDIEIKDFIRQVEDFKQTISHEFIKGISEVKSNVTDLQADIKHVKETLKRITENTIPTHIQGHFKRRIDKWRKEDKKFVVTSGSKYVMKCIEQNGCVSIIGNSGTGKTFTARHTALLMEKMGYLIIPLSKTQDLNFFEHHHKTLFVVDDLCGKFTLNERYLDDWKCELGKIESFLNDKCFKIIATCRLQVYQDVNFKLSLFNVCTCNLSSSAFSLTSDEIDGFKDSYLSDKDEKLPELNKEIDFYPLLFSLYNENENRDINSFFDHPFECYVQELNALENEGPVGRRKYCGLVLCVLFNNTLCEEDILGITSSRKDAIKHIILECGAERSSRKQICTEIESLQNTFVKKEHVKYKIIHDKMFDFLARYFGNNLTDICIKYAHPDFFIERFVWSGSCVRGERANFIQLNDVTVYLYIDRMIDMWEEGNVVKVFLNTILVTSDTFRERFFKRLKGKPKYKQKQLGLKPDNHKGWTSLHTTCKFNHVKVVQELLRNDQIDVNVCDNDEQTALQLASHEGKVSVVKLLLQHSVDLNKPDKEGWTPLHLASYNNHLEVLKELLKDNCVNVDACDNEDHTSLYFGCQRGNIDVIRLLLNHTIDVNKADKHGWTPLHQAWFINRIDVMETLLKSENINVDVCDHGGRTPLVWACQRGNADVVRLLLQHHANINKPDRNGCTPLHTACKMTHMEAITELLKSNQIDVDVCSNDGKASLHLACTRGNAGVVRLLLQHRANINKPDKNGFTPIHLACCENHVNVVDTLLENEKVDVDVFNKEGHTSLYIACLIGNADVIRLLLQHSANINKPDKDGWTPLHTACYKKHSEVVQELLKSDQIDVDICDDNGKSSLHLACQEGNANVARLLLQHHANINKPDKDGWTPLHTACYSNHVEVVKELLKSNQIDIDVFDNEGKSSLYTACEGGNVYVVRLLLQHSANISKQDNTGLTPLHVACYKNHATVVQELLKTDKIYVDISCNEGTTSLYLACQEGNVDVVRLLLQHHANLNKPDKDGWTPLHTACYSNHVEVVKELLKSDHIDIHVLSNAFHTSLYLACSKGSADVVGILLQHSANKHKPNHNGWTPLHIACYNNHVDVVQ